MNERILIAVAWPYVNGDLHLGHLAGCFLPSDIFARCHRLKGNDVLMVSGSDQHGTPIAVKAEQEHKSPQDIVDHFHARFCEVWQQLGISFDLYTSTGTANHAAVTQRIFLNLIKKGYIEKQLMQSPFCPGCSRFLPDRFVLGACPKCKSADARGDQCDGCQSLLDPTDLVDWRCGLCGATPELRDTEHFFLRLDMFNARLLDWVKQQADAAGWRSQVRNETLGMLTEGLRPRAITRDLAWGVRLPLDGFDDKRIYVWFEAVIGYLSASLEWAERRGEPEAWKRWWLDHATKSYYFIGKDNLPFHTLIWPAMLIGLNEAPALFEQPLAHAHDVPANQHLTIERAKFSKRRNWAIWARDFLSRYDPDPLRYALAINMPEAADTDFSWSEFLRRNNEELVATYGNAVHRALNIATVSFEGKVPVPGTLAAIDEEMLARIDSVRDEVEVALSRCSFREAIRAAMTLAQALNVYLDRKAPWQQVKQDKAAAAATTIYVALQVIANLRVLFAPFLPFSSAKLGELLNSPPLQDGDWKRAELPIGRALQKPQPLFKKLEPTMVAEELARLEGATREQTMEEGSQPAAEPTNTITYDDFMKVELRTAKVLKAERIPKADKLLKLQVDLGTEQRQILAGVAEYFTPEQMIGRTVVVVANLAPRKIRGEISQGMLLAAGDDEVKGLVGFEVDVPPGTRVR